jgi:YVTN family beta-propeller protein
MAPRFRPTCAATLIFACAPVASALQSFAYIANSGEKSVSVINLATETVVDTIELPGSSPWSVAAHPDGTRVYVATNGWVRVIDTATRTVVDSIYLDSNWTQHLALSPDGSTLYAEGEGDFFLWEISAIDTATNTITANTFAFQFTDQFSVSADGSRVYDLGSLSPSGSVLGIRDAQSLQVIDQIQFGDGFRCVVAHPNGEALFLGSQTSVLRLDPVNYEIDWREEITFNGQMENLLVSVDGTRVYAPSLGTNKTHVLDAETGDELGLIPISGRGIDQHPLGHLVYITLQSNDRVAIVDAESFAVLDVVAVGDGPVSAGGNFVTPFLCGPSLFGEDAGNSASLSAEGGGTTGSTLTLSYAQPPADASFAFSYVALGNDAAPFLGETLLLDAGQLLFPTPGVVFSSAGQILEESLSIAADPALVHLDVFLQAAFVELGAPNAVTLSNGVSLTVCQP